MKRGSVAFLVVMAWSLTQVWQAAASEWTFYVNPRFGTAAVVPDAGFGADPAPENGDGQSWTALDGYGHISVFGSYIVVADDFAGYREFTMNAAREDGVDIIYSAGKRDWFVYSGYRQDNIVYEKVVLSNECATPVANHIHLEYPKVQRDHYDRIVERMAASLHGGRGLDCD